MEATMIRRTLVALATLPFLAGGCSTLQVSTDYDTKADYGALKTYCWAEPDTAQRGDPRINWPFVDERVRRAVDQELAAKGYAQAPAGQADFTLVYYLVLENKVEAVHAAVPAMYPMYGYRYSVGRNVYWTSTPPTEVRQYTEGSLILDIVDARTKQALWRGTARARLIENAKPAEREQRINDAVKALLKKFPPPR